MTYTSGAQSAYGWQAAFSDPFEPDELAERVRYSFQRMAIKSPQAVALAAEALCIKPQTLWNRLAAPPETWGRLSTLDVTDMAWAFGRGVTFKLVPCVSEEDEQ